MPELPGVPLESGFTNWRPASDVEVAPEAKARVLEKIESARLARLRAMETAATYVVGAS